MFFEDNMGAVRTSRTDRITQRTKPIEKVIFHHVRLLVANNEEDVKRTATYLKRNAFSRKA